MQGVVASHCHSPTLDRYIAMALLADGRKRMGETLYAMSPVAGRTVAVTVTSQVFFDPEGKRLRD